MATKKAYAGYNVFLDCTDLQNAKFQAFLEKEEIRFQACKQTKRQTFQGIETVNFYGTKAALEKMIDKFFFDSELKQFIEK